MRKIVALLFFVGVFGNAGAQTDTIPPTLVCKDSYFSYVDTMAVCWAEITAAKLLDTVYDDSNGEIALGLRFDCATTGFPTKSYGEFFVGSTLTEVWAKDSAGNTSSCLLRVKVYDLGFCDPAVFECRAVSSEQRLLPNTTIIFDAGNCIFDSIHFELKTTTLNPYPNFIGGFRPGFYSTVTPSRNQNPLNGITTYDLLLIQKHLLGIEPLNPPYGLVAADVNLDGQITAGDLLLLRKLLLGIIDELPHGKSWRFVLYDYHFPNLFNPFDPAFPERYFISPSMYPPLRFEFIGIKLGDVNFSADPNY